MFWQGSSGGNVDGRTHFHWFAYRCAQKFNRWVWQFDFFLISSTDQFHRFTLLFQPFLDFPKPKSVDLLCFLDDFWALPPSNSIDSYNSAAIIFVTFYDPVLSMSMTTFTSCYALPQPTSMDLYYYLEHFGTCQQIPLICSADLCNCCDRPPPNSIASYQTCFTSCVTFRKLILPICMTYL